MNTDSRRRFRAVARAFLDRSLNFEGTLANVIRLVVPRVADYAAIALPADDGAITWGYSAHCNPDKEALVGRLRSYQPHRSLATFTTATTQSEEVQLIQTVDSDVLRRVAHDDMHLALLSGFGLTSIIILRLITRGRILGSLVLATSTDSGRRYDGRDIAIATDVARRVAAALDRALLFRAAERAARAREEVLAVVAHDLKNPVHTIQLAACFLLDEVVSDDPEREQERTTLGVIARSARQMDRLIRDLLDVSAIEAGQLALEAASLAVDLIVDDALELLRPIAASRCIALVADLPRELPRVTADRDRVLQVLSNLGGNAVKFSPEGGRVEIAARAADTVVEFAVRDNGPGIAYGDLPHIFDRFWQQKPTARLGTGLGLAIAKGIIDAHGGELRAESEPGKGSCFKFTLPVTGD
jgi:signal transduction histidine kinase